MATIEYPSAKNWFDLHLLIDDYFTHYNGYIFRGQADAEWRLESTLTRALNKSHFDKKLAERLKSQHFCDFKANIRGRCALNLETASDDEIWALGQHFGLHTPLLDWTRSPYVALFFSLFGECESGNRVLWALLEEDIDAINAKAPPSRKLRIVSPLTHNNPRLLSQNGLFLDVPVGQSVEKVVASAKKSECVTMYKISFPDEIRNDILSALNNMNINHATLFQDLAGSALHTNFQLEIEPYLAAARNGGFRNDC